MSIVLNEYEWAERAIRNQELGRKPVETLSRVAKYYYANHYGKKEIRELLDSFILKCDPKARLNNWTEILDKMVKNINKYPIVQLDGVDVTEEELDTIAKLEGKQIRRLAFTLLCIAKFNIAVKGNSDGWVNTPDNEIMKMANISTSIKRQSLMFAQLKDSGLIRFSKKIDNLSVQVLFIQDGRVAMHIHDFRNLGYQYLAHYEKGYIECANCGITVKAQSPAKGRPQKYCPSCAIEIKTQQTIDAVMRNRCANKNIVS